MVEPLGGGAGLGGGDYRWEYFKKVAKVEPMDMTAGKLDFNWKVLVSVPLSACSSLPVPLSLSPSVLSLAQSRFFTFDISRMHSWTAGQQQDRRGALHQLLCRFSRHDRHIVLDGELRGPHRPCHW